jgi:hypothetical protein
MTDRCDSSLLLADHLMVVGGAVSPEQAYHLYRVVQLISFRLILIKAFFCQNFK